MLHDPSKERPADPAHAVLWDAAGYIEEHGWCQNHFMYGERVCAIGAISGFAQGTMLVDALKLFSAYICTNFIPHWNDTLGRTQDEVVLALRGAALSVKI